MYSYTDYYKNHKVVENGTMGRHTNNSPPPVLCDGKRRPIRDRLQGITTAMSWIKEELEVIKEQDKSLRDIFEKVRGDVQELNSYISLRGSASIPTTPASAKPQTLPNSASLELDFDAIDDDEEPTQNGEVQTSSLSGSPPSPDEFRGFTSSGTSYSNLDVGLVKSGSHGSNSSSGGSSITSSRSPNLSSKKNTNGQPRVVAGNGVVAPSQEKTAKDGSLENPASVSVSLSSLDLDFSTMSFGLGTISEGRSLLNIPINTATSSSSGVSSSGDNSPSSSSSLSANTGGIQRSISQQPLFYPDIAGQGRKYSYQHPKRDAPQTLPKPRRDSRRQAPPPPLQQQQPPPPIANVQPVNSGAGRRASLHFMDGGFGMGSNLIRSEMMRSTPALDKKSPTSSPSQSQKKNPRLIPTPLLSLQAQQELRETARQLKQEARSRGAANGCVPHLQGTAESRIQQQQQQGSSSPRSQRRQAPVLPSSNKQPSPPLSSANNTHHTRDSPGSNVKLSPRHRVLPPSSSPKLHASTVPDTKSGSGTPHKLTPPTTTRGVQEVTMTTTSISRDSSVDSGIQFAGEGENGGGGVSGDNVTSSGGGSEGVTVGISSVGDKMKKKGDAKVEDKGLDFGDFASDVFSAIANMKGPESSWLS